MVSLSQLRATVRKSQILRRLIAFKLIPMGLFDKKFMEYPISDAWKLRIETVKKCPDNAKIRRISGAGVITKGRQIMHNGLLINLGSYYGPDMAIMLFENEGVHEPQEEYIFQEVLPYIRNGGTMIELGSYWGFYSMWFNKNVRNAQNYMVEPDFFNLMSGKMNFKLNGLKGEFINAFVGKQSKKGKPVVICVDDFVKDNNIPFVDILHSDIQGFEYEMLQGAARTIRLGRIGYFFISTHSNDIHYACVDFLRSNSYNILCEVDLENSFSEDGLIVAKLKSYEGIESIRISSLK